MLIDSPEPCPECGEYFRAPRKQFNQGRRFCARECFYEWSKNQPGKNMRACLQCQTVFNAVYDVKDRKSPKWCSVRCKQLYRGIIKVCVGCGSEFNSYDPKRKYCSRRCYREKHPVTMISYVCPVCGKTFERDERQVLRKDKNPDRVLFCGMTCFGLGRRGENHPDFRGGNKAYRGMTWLEQKKRIHAMFPRCRFCECQTEGRGRHVDHIVPWRIAKLGKRDPNDDRNLWVLCRGCHAKKTHAEAILFREGRKQYEAAVLKIAGREDVQYQLWDAFTYCGIAEVKSLTVVVLRKARKQSGIQQQNEFVFV